MELSVCRKPLAQLIPLLNVSRSLQILDPGLARSQVVLVLIKSARMCLLNQSVEIFQDAFGMEWLVLQVLAPVPQLLEIQQLVHL